VIQCRTLCRVVGALETTGALPQHVPLLRVHEPHAGVVEEAVSRPVEGVIDDLPGASHVEYEGTEACLRQVVHFLADRGLGRALEVGQRCLELRSEERRVGKECRARWWWWDE